MYSRVFNFFEVAERFDARCMTAAGCAHTRHHALVLLCRLVGHDVAQAFLHQSGQRPALGGSLALGLFEQFGGQPDGRSLDHMSRHIISYVRYVKVRKNLRCWAATGL